MYDVMFYSVGGRGLHRMAKEKLLSKHYLKRLPPISHAFMAMKGDDVVGVLTFGVPPSRHLQMSACPTGPGNVLELNRLWVDDAMPRNFASFFIARALDRLSWEVPAIIVSYADTAAGHLGYVYRASNFYYAGWTDMDRKTPRLDYVPTDLGEGQPLFGLQGEAKHSRDAFRSGSFETVRRKPKVKYWTVTGNRKQKREMRKICGWPIMDWKTEPPMGVAA
jgi:hypothetical protein